MTGIILLEIISIVSFLYSILLIFLIFAPLSNIFIIFIWTILVSLFFAKYHTKSKLSWASLIILFLPLVFYHSSPAIYFMILTNVPIALYISKSLFRGGYDEYLSKLKKSYLLYTLMAMLGLMFDGFNGFISYGIPFIIIYLLTTTILVRTMRHLDAGMDTSKIKKINTKYLTIITLVSFVATLDKLRNFIFKLITTTFQFILSIILAILYYPMYFLVTVINRIIVFLMNMIMSSGILDREGLEVEEFQPYYVEEEILEVGHFDKLIGIGLFILLIYIIYRIIAKIGDRSIKGVEYTEDREYIREPKKRRRIFKERYPTDLKEQIRYYYRRYLEKLDKKKVEVLKSDTSLEINHKAEETFKEDIERIREIYIDSRYGDKEVGRDRVKEIGDLYKKL